MRQNDCYEFTKVASGLEDKQAIETSMATFAKAYDLENNGFVEIE